MRPRLPARLAALALSTAAFVVAGPARGDVVHLVDGGKIEGRVEREGDNVRIELRGGTVTLPASRVASIETTPADAGVERLRADIEAASTGDDAALCAGLADRARALGLTTEEGALLAKAVQLAPRDLALARRLRDWRVNVERLEPAEGAVQSLGAAIGEHPLHHRTKHWIMAYDVKRSDALARAEMLESAWTRYFEMTDAMGLEPRPVTRVLEALLFSDHAAWRASIPLKGADIDRLSGLFVHETGRIHLYLTATSPTARQAQEQADRARDTVAAAHRVLDERSLRLDKLESELAVARMTRESRKEVETRIAEEREHIVAERARIDAQRQDVGAFEDELDAYLKREDFATTTHEACHQLAFATGVCRPGQSAWLIEGLATLFEAESRNTLLIDSVNQPRLRDLRDAREKGAALSLRAVVDDAEFAAGGPGRSVAYAHAWGLAYFLYRTRPEAFARYVRDCKPFQAGAEHAAERRAEFQVFFGDDLDALETAWVRFLDRL